MDLDAFRESLSEESPPRGVAPPLAALWHEARGDWERAHRIVQDEQGADAARVHAYLHRREGDRGNADYWYSRSGDERPRGALEKEWEELVLRFLPGAVSGKPQAASRKCP